MSTHATPAAVSPSPLEWQEKRHNWSTTESAVFRTPDLSIFTAEELARGQIIQGDGGWLTVPANALVPDCEPVGRKCACGREG